jgi:7,8-dihydropterin-6-yl-methyl-4-(beta-D-ribofuranosyl)aminobenzene 5'-phosphate synthase
VSRKNAVVFGWSLTLAGSPPTFAAETPKTITVLYDNYVFDQACRSDWGFACLISGTEKTILFDTLVFRRQELVNHDEDAFDHLLTGSGYCM